MKNYKKIRFFLGDQLNVNHSWFSEDNSDTLFVMMEVKQETNYVRHHIQKVILFFLGMRSFMQSLKQKGLNIEYIRLNDTNNKQSIPRNLERIIKERKVDKFEYQQPDEHRLSRQMKEFCASLDIESECFSTEHFLSSPREFKEIFDGKKTYLMETFYRKMRKKYGVLLDKDENPIGGKWNYDAENRKKLPKSHEPLASLSFDADTESITSMLEEMNIETIGNVEEGKVYFPYAREQALRVLEEFMQNRLALFGTYQDAMTDKNHQLYHSKISFAMNVKLISPQEVIQEVENYWQNNQEEISLAQVEGFIRQILGWREYMRNIYWLKMPEYGDLNFFGNERKLPEFFWTGKTKMKCLETAINHSLDYAYAHHIQRLMVTGNFTSLLGVHPDEVDEWYLGIYADALEWVEITNTRGMSQFADGGIVGTKPYVASANYMHKMGDHCSNCKYKNKEKIGEDACPFNSLYWDFFDRNREKLEKNPRIGMAYRTWDKMDGEKKAAILKQAAWIKENVDDL